MTVFIRTLLIFAIIICSAVYSLGQGLPQRRTHAVSMSVNVTEQDLINAKQALDSANTNASKYRARIALANLYYELRQPDDGLRELDAANLLKIKRKDKAPVATATMLRGIMHSLKGELDKAIEYLNIALQEFSKQPNDHEGYLRTLRHIADIQNYNNNYPKSAECLNQCVEYCNSHQLDENIRLRYLASIYLQWATILKNKGEYGQAREKMHLSLQCASTLVDNDHTFHADLAEIESSQAALEIDMKDYMRAKAMCEDAYGIYSKCEFGDTDETLEGKADLLNTYGNLYSALGQYADASRKYNESLTAYSKLLESSNSKYSAQRAQVLGNIAVMYDDMGDFANALEHYKEAATQYKILAQTRPTYLSAYANIASGIGDLYRRQGNTDSALYYMEQGLQIYRDKAHLTDDEKADYSTICNNLAILHRQNDRLAIAEQFYETAYHIRKELMEKSERYLPLWADILNNYGLYFIDIKDNDLAIYYLNKALEIRLNQIATNPNILADNYDNLAYAFYMAHLPQDAAANYEKSRAIRRDLVLNSNMPERYIADYISTMQNLASLYKQSNQGIDALAATIELRETLSQLHANSPSEYLDEIASAKHNTALLYGMLNQKAQAADAMNLAIKDYNVLALQDHDKYLPEVAAALNQAANYYSDLGDYVNAEKYYQKALDINTELYEEHLIDPSELAGTLNNLG
nr:tetratricopeptide repeat protein [Bacteroidales bacterium]